MSFSARIKNIFDALFYTCSAVKGCRASSLISAMSRLTSEYLLARVQALVTADVMTQAEGAQLSDTDLGAGFKKFVMEDLHGPKSGELLTWFPTFTHKRLRPAMCWGGESLQGKTVGSRH